MRKVKNNKGETLIESLVALCILSIIMLGFPTIVGEVSKLDATIKRLEKEQDFDKAKATEVTSGITLQIKDEYTKVTYTFDNTTKMIKAYKFGDFYFYEAE